MLANTTLLWRSLDLRGQLPSPGTRAAPPTPVELDLCTSAAPSGNLTSSSLFSPGLWLRIRGTGAQATVSPGPLDSASRCALDDVWVSEGAFLELSGSPSSGNDSNSPLVVRGNLTVAGVSSSVSLSAATGSYDWDAWRWNGSVLVQGTSSLSLVGPQSGAPLALNASRVAFEGSSIVRVTGRVQVEADGAFLAPGATIDGTGRGNGQNTAPQGCQAFRVLGDHFRYPLKTTEEGRYFKLQVDQQIIMGVRILSPANGDGFGMFLATQSVG